MTETKTTPRRSNRSSEQSRAAILQATRNELAENGWRKFSVDKVSRSAKASKQTIYRWWPAIGNMCIEAAITLIPAHTSQGRDPAERIADLIRPLEMTIQTGSGHSVLRAAILASCDDNEAGITWRAWLKDNIRAPLRLILAEIASKRVIRRDFELEDAMDTLLGPMWNRVLTMRAPLPPEYSLRQSRLLISQLAP